MPHELTSNYYGLSNEDTRGSGCAGTRIFLHWHQLHVTGQFHVPAALSPKGNSLRQPMYVALSGAGKWSGHYGKVMILPLPSSSQSNRRTVLPRAPIAIFKDTEILALITLILLIEVGLLITLISMYSTTDASKNRFCASLNSGD
jgi:hypothetical protein